MSKNNQITDTILMVRPANFGFNKQTAESNAFQQAKTTRSSATIKAQAIEEFDAFVAKLRSQGIKVIVAQDGDTPVKTDAVFPNNWVTFHEDGTVILYPMCAPNRRIERQQSVLDTVFSDYDHTKVIDFSNYESKNIFLEGTGSLILDRLNKIAYACTSPRTNDLLLTEFCQLFGYKKVVFRAVDKGGQDIYHTNVMMALGETFVVICMDSIRSLKESGKLQKYFQATGKDIIAISHEQMNAFAGNMLQVKNEKGDTFLVMSEQAFKSLTPEQIKRIEKHTAILHSPIYTIEKFGGGSARCMMAEMFLPKEVEIAIAD